MMANWVGEYTRDAANYPVSHKALLAAAVSCLPIAIILHRSRNFTFIFLGLSLLISISVSLWDYKAQIDMSRDGTAELVISSIICYPLIPPTNIYFFIRPVILYLKYMERKTVSLFYISRVSLEIFMLTLLYYEVAIVLYPEVFNGWADFYR